MNFVSFSAAYNFIKLIEVEQEKEVNFLRKFGDVSFYIGKEVIFKIVDVPYFFAKNVNPVLRKELTLVLKRDKSLFLNYPHFTIYFIHKMKLTMELI